MHILLVIVQSTQFPEFLFGVSFSKNREIRENCLLTQPEDTPVYNLWNSKGNEFVISSFSRVYDLLLSKGSHFSPWLIFSDWEKFVLWEMTVITEVSWRAMIIFLLRLPFISIAVTNAHFLLSNTGVSDWAKYFSHALLWSKGHCVFSDFILYTALSQKVI